MHAVAGERVQVRGQGADQGLALTSLHLGDAAHVHRGPTHELHVEMPLAECSLGGLADDRERFGQEVVRRLAGSQPLPKGVGLRLELPLGHLDVVGLERVDVVGDGPQPTEDLSLAGAQDLLEYHGGTSSSGRLTVIVGGATP